MSRPEIPRIARILGAGVSAASAATSLVRFGWYVEMSAPTRCKGYAIALNAPCRYLLDRIWGPDLLASLPHHLLTHRSILWRNRVPRRIDDAAMVVNTTAIAERMTAKAVNAGVSIAEISAIDQPTWTIVATGRDAHSGMTSGGNRIALVAPLAIAATADSRALVIEAVTRGWVALMPTGPDCGVVFACLPAVTGEAADTLDGMVAETKIIRPSIAAVTGPCVVVDAAPRLRQRHGDVAGVFAGDAAIALDPVSGDGVTAALRTAYLGASIAETYARGVALQELRAFYAYRLERAMSVHLRGLLTLYADAPFATFWTEERAAMRDFAVSLATRLNTSSAPLFAISQSGLGPLPDFYAEHLQFRA